MKDFESLACWPDTTRMDTLPGGHEVLPTATLESRICAPVVGAWVRVAIVAIVAIVLLALNKSAFCWTAYESSPLSAAAVTVGGDGDGVWKSQPAYLGVPTVFE